VSTCILGIEAGGGSDLVSTFPAADGSTDVPAARARMAQMQKGPTLQIQVTWWSPAPLLGPCWSPAAAEFWQQLRSWVGKATYNLPWHPQKSLPSVKTVPGCHQGQVPDPLSPGRALHPLKGVPRGRHFLDSFAAAVSPSTPKLAHHSRG
jgi:hypothetical protein